MKTVKLSSRESRPNLLRQTPGGKGYWRGYQFSPPNDATDKADHWIVLHGLKKTETVSVRSGKVILISYEPPDNKKHHPKFLAQFDAVYSCDTSIDHSNLIVKQQGLPWFVGEKSDGRPDSVNERQNFMTYDDFCKLTMPAKTDLISTVTSRIAKTPGHIYRLRFLERLQREFPDLKTFGRGNTPISDKLEAIAPFHFHLVLENSQITDYWTEKLADSYLGFSFPIYWGAPNIGSYFPEDSFLEIDIHKWEESVAKIRELISQPLSQRRKEALYKARELVLNRYNAFEVMAAACDAVQSGDEAIRTIKPQEAFAGFRTHHIVHRIRRWLKTRKAQL